MTDYSNIYMNPEMSQSDLYTYDKMRSYGAKMAPPSTMFGSASQSLFPTSSDFGPGVGFRSGQIATSEFGAKDYFKHEILNRHRALGTNALDMKLAQDEYKHLWAGSAMGEAGAAATGASVGTMIGGLPGFLIGGALGMAGETMSKPYMQGYGRTQSASTVTSSILNTDGTMGISGKDNKQLGRFMQDEADKDMFMEEADYQQLLKKVKSGGGMKAITAGRAMEKELKNWTDDIKELSSLFGDGNIEKLADEMLNFVRKGMSRKGAKSMVTTIKGTAAISDMTEDAISGIVGNAYHQAQVSGYMDERMAANKASTGILDHKTLQGTGLLSGNLLQGEAYSAAFQKVEMQAEMLAHKEGVSSDKLSMLAKKDSAVNGTSFKESFDKFSKMKIEDVLSASDELFTDHEKYVFNGSRARVGQYVRENVSDEEMASVSDYSASNTLVKKYVEEYGLNGGLEAVYETLGVDKEGGQLIKARYLAERMKNGFDGNGVSSAAKAKQRFLEASRSAQDVEDYEKYTSVWETTSRGFSQAGTQVGRFFLGGWGEDSAADQIDKRRDVLFGTSSVSSTVAAELKGMTTKRAAGKLLSGSNNSLYSVTDTRETDEEAKLDEAKKYARDETVYGEGSFLIGPFRFNSDKKMEAQSMDEVGFGIFKRDDDKSTAGDFNDSANKISAFKKREYNKFAGIKTSIESQLSSSDVKEYGKNIDALSYQLSINGGDIEAAKNAVYKEGFKDRAHMEGFGEIMNGLDLGKAVKAKIDPKAFKAMKMKKSELMVSMLQDVRDGDNVEEVAELYKGLGLSSSDMRKGMENITILDDKVGKAMKAAIGHTSILESGYNTSDFVADEKDAEESIKTLAETGIKHAFKSIDKLSYSGKDGEGDKDEKKLNEFKRKAKKIAATSDSVSDASSGIAKLAKTMGMQNLEGMSEMTSRVGSMDYGSYDEDERGKAASTMSGLKKKALENKRKQVLSAVGFDSDTNGNSFLQALSEGKDLDQWKEEEKKKGVKFSKAVESMNGEEMMELTSYAMKFGDNAQQVKELSGGGVSPGEAAIVVEVKGVTQSIKDLQSALE